LEGESNDCYVLEYGILVTGILRFCIITSFIHIKLQIKSVLL